MLVSSTWKGIGANIDESKSVSVGWCCGNGSESVVGRKGSGWSDEDGVLVVT